MTIDWGAVALLIPSFALGILGYVRATKGDAVIEKSGVLSATAAGTAWFVDQLQEDNKELKAERDAVTKERDDLKRQLTRMQRKFGNGDNGP